MFLKPKREIIDGRSNERNSKLPRRIEKHSSNLKERSSMRSNEAVEPIANVGDYITIIDAPPILEKWRGRRAQITYYNEALKHYGVMIDNIKILLSADEIIMTANDPESMVPPMRSTKEIEAKIHEITSAPPLPTHGPVWKSAILTALLWVLREKSASALMNDHK